MTLQFKEAVRTGGWSRTALTGVSGSGKSFTGLSLLAGMGKKLAVIDTENRSLRKYLGDIVDIDGNPIKWDALELDSFSPLVYIEALEAAKGYDAVLVDSASHAWIGKGGQLEQVDNIAKRSQSGNSFAAWRDVSPQHTKMIDTIVHSPFHIILTMRSKSEWVVMEDDRGRKVPKKIGMSPIQKGDSIEYEVDFYGDMTLEHEWILSKSRLKSLDNQTVLKPDAKIGKLIADWAALGVKGEPIVPMESETVKADLLQQIAANAAALGFTKQALSERIQATHGGKRGVDLTNDELQALNDNLPRVLGREG